LGVNAASGFAGNLLDLQVNGTSRFLFTAGGLLTLGGRTSSFAISAGGDERFYYQNGNGWRLERFNGGATIGLESIYQGLFIGHQGSGTGGLAASSGGAGTAIDTFLIRDRQANTWGQRNGTNAQTFRLYNTYTDTNNYERHTHSWSGDVLNIANEAAGSGTLRSIAFSANGATSTPPVTFTGTWFTGGLAATTKPQVLIEPTGTTSAAWSTSGTGLGVNAASGFAGNLLDLQVNGTSVASVNANGRISTAGGGAGGLSSPSWIDIFVTGGANPFYRLSNGSLRVAQAASNGSPSIELCGGWANSSGDVVITRDAANTLAQRRSTNAQTFRCYGTYTDASNYVRAALSSTSTAVTLAAETEGTGADDISLNLTAAGTGTVKINSVAEVAASSIVTGLPTAPTVGMIARVTDATTPTVGSTVTGGGAAAALVWYNGTSWTILGV
jgi:hypothetical protein